MMSVLPLCLAWLHISCRRGSAANDENRDTTNNFARAGTSGADTHKGALSGHGQGQGQGQGPSRPNCIILDEIDGVDGRATIDALLAIIKVLPPPPL